MDHALADVAAMLQLQAAEVRVREEARGIELDPARQDEARALFRLADRIRAERLALRGRWGLD